MKNVFGKVFCLVIALTFAFLLLSCASLTERILSRDDDTRTSALEEIRKMDNDSKEKLVPVLMDNLYERYAVDALVVIGPPAVPALIARAKAGDDNPAISALGEIGPAARDAIPSLIHMLVFEDGIGNQFGENHCRVKVIDALEAIGHDAVPALIGELGNENSAVREDINRILKAVGPVTKADVPKLLVALGNEKSRKYAAGILGDMGSDASEAVPALIVNCNRKLTHLEA